VKPERIAPDDREVAVIGLGRSGVAATRLLLRSGRPVYASDGMDTNDAGKIALLEKLADGLRTLGASVDLGRHDLARIARAGLCIVSPGVPPDAPPIAAARSAGVTVQAEAELGLEAMDGIPYIAVTGTNGKTTTTALIAHLLASTGCRAEAAGNIGTPLSEIALEPVLPEWLAVELSSFQLHDMQRLDPDVGVLTNLAPDHLDRYPALVEYYADKRRLFQRATDDSVWVTNADDPASRDIVRGIAGQQLRFSVVQRSDGWYDSGAGLLRIGTEALLPRAELALMGDHNVANALAAALAVHATGVSLPEIAKGLATFVALPHRMEPVGEVSGVLWINDSKATNVASTEMAVRALTRPFVLLLGGRHKGEPYTRLAPLLDGRCRAVIAYGEAEPIVVADLAGSKTPVVTETGFDAVMARARRLAQPGDAVLLSPACSSYDMFANYEARGRRFREIVESW
jgi:UDP-N-acetylmuramoylalanine--D-glutamate ligase